MNDEILSLDGMQDIVLPSPVEWWPLAPGWWALSAIAFVVSILLALAMVRHWRRNAYRRAALRELRQAADIATVATLLKRTALAVYPRETVASLSGERWLHWLDASASEPIPKEVRPLLLAASYQDWRTTEAPDALRGFARQWIMEHRRPC